MVHRRLVTSVPFHGQGPQLAAAMRVPEVVGWSWWSDPVIELDPPMLIGGLINDPY